MKAWILGMAAVVATAGIGSGLGLPLVAPAGQKVLFIGEDMDGRFFMEEIELDHAGACGSTVPLGPDACSTGSHVRAGASVSHGFSAFPNCGAGAGAPVPAQAGRCYVGVATSKLTHGAGARVFICNIEYYPAAPASLGLNQISCAGSGTFPAIGATFTHDCLSDDQGTAGNGDGGTGLGTWGCNLSHS